MDPTAYITQHENRFLAQLQELLRIPSISALTAHRDDVAAPRSGSPRTCAPSACTASRRSPTRRAATRSSTASGSTRRVGPPC